MAWNPFSDRKPAPLETGLQEISSIYYSRPECENALKDGLSKQETIAIYGPARQGKTMLLGKFLPPHKNLYVECRPGFKRSHIYRLILSHLGYSIVLEGKKKRSAKANVKFNIFGAGV